MTGFSATFAREVVRLRWVIIPAAVIVLIVVASGMRLLTFNNDTRIFFSEDNPELLALEALEDTYLKEQNVFFILAPKEGSVFTRSTLTAIEELTQGAWQIPFSSRVDSITNFQHTRAEGDDLIVEDLVSNANDLSDAALKKTRKIATTEPLLVHSLVSPSGHVSAVNVNIILPGKSLSEVPEVTAFARGMASDIESRYTDIKVYLTGAVIMDNAFGEASQKDMATLTPLMFLILLAIIGITLRSITGTFATFVIITFSMLAGLGLAGWFGISLNAATVNAPQIILTLAVADSVHILAIVFNEMRAGRTKLAAVEESVRVNLKPVFLTSLTTVIGFLTMNFSDAPPLRDLGNVVAIGVAAAFFFSVTLLPALVAVLPVKVTEKVKEGGGAHTPMCTWIAELVIRRRTAVMICSLVLSLALTLGVFQVELDDHFLKYFSKHYNIRQSTDFMTENLTGADAIEYSLESGEIGGINDPAYLQKLEEFAEWYKKDPKVDHVNTITEIIKRLNMNMHGDDEAYYRVPETRELAAQYLLLYEMSLPYGLDLNNQINVDKSATRMIVNVKDASAKELRKIEARGRQWLKSNAPEDMFTYGSGLSMIWAHISERNIKSMMLGAFLALILISFILAFALKSVRLGLISLIPNLAPALMAYGVWGYLDGQVGIGLSVVASMTLGIVVDDTVHFLSKYLIARREHKLNPEDSIRYAFNTVGTAMWVTTLAVGVGFMVLAFSSYKMNSDMGLLTAITITIALVMDFFLLPTILISAFGKGRA